MKGRTHARTHARTDARTHARTQARTHKRRTGAPQRVGRARVVRKSSARRSQPSLPLPCRTAFAPTARLRGSATAAPPPLTAPPRLTRNPIWLLPASKKLYNGFERSRSEPDSPGKLNNLKRTIIRTTYDTVHAMGANKHAHQVVVTVTDGNGPQTVLKHAGEFRQTAVATR